MAIYYVDSTATGGTDTGGSWTNAYLSLASAVAVVGAGDDVLVDDGHSEDFSSLVSWTFASIPHENPVRFLCVDKADDSDSIGAAITTSAAARFTISGGSYWRGFSFSGAERVYFQHSAAKELITLERCHLLDCNNRWYIGNADNSFQGLVRLIDTDITLAGTDYIRLFCKLEWHGGTLTSSSSTTGVFEIVTSAAGVECIGVDLSSFDQNPLVVDEPNTLVHSRTIIGCKVKSGATPVNAAGLTPESRTKMIHCSSGTSADPSYYTAEQCAQGFIETDTARYLDTADGASDGLRTNPLSWSMLSNTECIELYDSLKSPPIQGWTPGDGSTSYTYTIHLAAGAILQDDEVWLEIYLPNDSETSSLLQRLTTRIDPQDTPANITQTGNSDWGGTDVGEEQTLSVAHTPDKPGPFIAFIHLAKPSERMSANPNVVITET